MAILEDEYFVVTQDDDYDDFYSAGGAKKAIELASLGKRLEYYPIDDNVTEPYIGELLKAPESLVFGEFVELIEGIEIDGVEFIPVNVKSEDGFEEYFLVNFTDPVSVFDPNESEYESITLSIHGIRKLVFNRESIDKLPKEKLHLFCMKESKGIMIVSEKFKNHIVKVYKSKYGMELGGFKFIPVSEYKS